MLLITLLINIPLNIVLISLLGTRGSALAVGLSWIPLYFMSVHATGLKLPVFGNRNWYRNILGGVCAYFLSYAINATFGEVPFHGEIILAIILYFVIFFFINKKILLEAGETIKSVRRKNSESRNTQETSIPLPH